MKTINKESNDETNLTCGETLDEVGCTTPNIPGMSDSVVVSCNEHDDCEKVYYYADTITYCPVCKVTSEGLTTHRCAIGHREVGTTSCYEVASVCKFW